MKKLAVFIAFFVVPAFAQQYPTIIGYITNQLNGRIIFTTEKGNCREKSSLVYMTGGGGEILGIGCWYKVDDQLFVNWQKTGDFYSYPIESLIWSDEWLKYSAR